MKKNQNCRKEPYKVTKNQNCRKVQKIEKVRFVSQTTGSGGGLTVDCETKRTFCKLSSDWSKKVRKKVRKLQVAGGLPVDCETKRTFCKPPSDWSLQTPCQHLRRIPGNYKTRVRFISQSTVSPVYDHC